MRELPNVYDIGKIRYVHAGFRVHKIVGKLNNPMEPVGKIHNTAEKALSASEDLGDGYAVFRIVQSKNGEEPRERINRDDLPIHIVS
jgi:hypothetical protein